MKALVTGGAGFIGSHLAERLRLEGWDVSILDDFSAGTERNTREAGFREAVTRGDVADLDVVRSAVNGTDVVFHLAALASVPQSMDDPMRTHEVNVTGTINVLLAAREALVKRVVFASSSAVYGEVTTEVQKETDPVAPVSPYAASKACGELYCQVFARSLGLEAVALRFFNVFGPRQNPFSQYACVIPKFVTMLLQGQSPTIFGTGEQTRDFVYVDDVVQACILAAWVQEARGKVFNIGAGRSYSVLQLFRALCDAVGHEVEPSFAGPRPGDVQHTRADIRLATSVLGYRVVVDFEEGIRRTVEWYRAHPELWQRTGTRSKTR